MAWNYPQTIGKTIGSFANSKDKYWIVWKYEKDKETSYSDFLDEKQPLWWKVKSPPIHRKIKKKVLLVTEKGKDHSKSFIFQDIELKFTTEGLNSFPKRWKIQKYFWKL